MKKLFAAIAAVLLFGACGGGGNGKFNYRGLSMELPYHVFCDSLRARGFAVDSAKGGDNFVVMTDSTVDYTVLVAYKDDKLTAVKEDHTAASNDSTRQLWQQYRDQFEKELGAWPDCPVLKDDYKIARFDARTGFITVTLKNTYTPTMSILYVPAAE